LFEDVPPVLNRRLAASPPEMRVPHMRAYFAALLVINHYLGEAFEGIRNNPFLVPENPDREWESQQQFVQIAEHIFSLRSEPGLPELCRRLAGKDLRAAYYETWAAVQMKDFGFSISARQERGVKGADFDFSAGAGKVHVNIEVTALQLASFKTDTILNKLRAKRKQLPDDAPAIIICFLSGTFWMDVYDLGFELAKVSRRFFGGTARINSIGFFLEIKQDLKIGGVRELRGLFTRNRNARFQPPELEQILNRDPKYTKESIKLSQAAHADGTNIGVGEFWEWVDQVMAQV